MKVHLRVAALAAALFIAAPLTMAPASAASVMQACSAKYQAAKSANTLGGATWGTFLRQCRAEGTGAIVVARAKKTAVAAGGNSAKACKANYKAAKAGGTLNGMKKKAFMAQCESGTAAAAPAAAAPAAPMAKAGTPKKTCNADYKAAKAGGTLNGMKKKAYMAQCEAGTAAPAAAPAAVTPAAAPVKATAPAAAGTQTAGRAAEHARQKQCGAQWRANKAQLIAATPGLTWPKYWSTCNKQLKAAGH
ncbi:MAG: hypothetical protein KGQ37_08715 [Hyphomicrobiales bacterium]|nr:hypothetical protein [Hyphomicrobiales bacterium]